MASFETRDIDGFRFIDEGPHTGVPVVMLHGMLGGVGNWDSTISSLVAAGRRAIAPILPVYDMPIDRTSVSDLSSYAAGFLDATGIERPVLVGNSLGGHVALMLALESDRAVSGLVLTGASGLHEVMIGNSRLKRHDPEYVRRKAELTFYDPKHVTDELVKDVLEVVWDRAKALRLIKIARSAKADTVRDRLGEIKAPSLLIWGRQDQVTPPDVAEDFQARIPNARLEFIDQCGHAPMMERPEVFDALLLDFVDQLSPASNPPSSLVARRANG